MSSIDEWCNAEDKNDKYIGLVELWIEGACSNTRDPWHYLVSLLHDNIYPITRSFQVMKELPTYACYMFGISLFCLETKHKGKTQGNDEFLGWLHCLYDFT
jgi:hypothetical protein